LGQGGVGCILLSFVKTINWLKVTSRREKDVQARRRLSEDEKMTKLHGTTWHMSVENW